jgi:thiosulfate/3-mercaptopyruvate sulfurtransferase
MIAEPTMVVDRLAETLVDPAWLWERRDMPEVLAVGCSAEGFLLGHLPGVVLPVYPFLKHNPLGSADIMDLARATAMIPADEFARVMESLGVTEHTSVVAYDDIDGTLSARLWWVLRYYGHEKVKVLDGGWHRWVMEGFSLAQKEGPHRHGHFVPVPHPDMACSTERLLERVRTRTATVVDARSRDEWQADPNYWGNKRRGRIPGSVHLDTGTLITEDLRTLRTSKELRLRLDEAGIPPAGEVVFYCQSGVAAALGALVLHLLGRDDGLLYEASMAEWANRDDTPLDCDADD